MHEGLEAGGGAEAGSVEAAGSMDSVAARDQPALQEDDLSTLQPRDVGAQLLQIRVRPGHALCAPVLVRVLILACVLLRVSFMRHPAFSVEEDIAHEDGALVVRYHGSHKVDGVLAGHSDAHARVHLAVRVDESLARRQRCLPAPHRHTLSSVLLAALHGMVSCHGMIALHVMRLLLVAPRVHHRVASSDAHGFVIEGLKLGAQPRLHPRNLQFLLPLDMVAEVHQPIQRADVLVLLARELVQQDIAHVHRAVVMRDHASHKVNVRVLGEPDRHARVHLHVDILPQRGRRGAPLSSTHHRVCCVRVCQSRCPPRTFGISSRVPAFPSGGFVAVVRNLGRAALHHWKAVWIHR
eukprot:2838111-Rhodomonas_salina.2